MVGYHAGNEVNLMSGRLLDAVPLSSLTGVGAAQSSKLAKIGLHTVQDLLLHLPLRYEDRTHLYPIAELLPGVYATVEGEVLNRLTVFKEGRAGPMSGADQCRTLPRDRISSK